MERSISGAPATNQACLHGVQVKPVVKAQPASTSLWKLSPSSENQKDRGTCPHPIDVCEDRRRTLNSSIHALPTPTPPPLHFGILLQFQRSGEPTFQMVKWRPEGVRALYLQFMSPSASQGPQKNRNVQLLEDGRQAVWVDPQLSFADHTSVSSRP